MIKKLLRIALKVFVAVGVFSVLRYGTYKATDGFGIGKISSTLPYHAEWDVKAPPTPQEFEEISKTLNQTFTYLGKGAQSFVFVSEDEQTVLKFFRHSHMRAPFWLTACPFPGDLEAYRQKKIRFCMRKLFKDFASYKVAFDELRDQTGLLYLHLNKTACFHKKIKIIDKIGIAHTLDLDKMEFLLQKKASLSYPALETLIVQGKMEEAKKALSSLVDLLVYRCKKGLFDKDPDLNTNFGFIGTKAVQIDIGRFRIDPREKDPAIYRKELLRVTDNLQQWLDVRAPELKTYLRQAITESA